MVNPIWLLFGIKFIGLMDSVGNVLTNYASDWGPQVNFGAIRCFSLSEAAPIYAVLHGVSEK